MEGYIVTIEKQDSEHHDAPRIKIFEQFVETLDIHKFIAALNVKPRKKRETKAAKS